MPKLIAGNKLTREQRSEVLRAFVHRWTHENPHRTNVYHCALCDIRTPYVNTESANGHTHPTIPLQSDEQWLTEHAFYIDANGALSEYRRRAEPVFMATERS